MGKLEYGGGGCGGGGGRYIRYRKNSMDIN